MYSVQAVWQRVIIQLQCHHPATRFFIIQLQCHHPATRFFIIQLHILSSSSYTVIIQLLVFVCVEFAKTMFT
jgi:hypothetical protein